MTAKQFKTLSDQRPSRFHPEFTKLVDKGAVGLDNASIAARLIPRDQMLLAFQAMNFSQKSFAATVNWWLRLSENRRAVMRQIIEDIADAFDEWERWAGNRVGDEVEEHEQMVKEARSRVLSYLAKLKVTLPRKDE